MLECRLPILKLYGSHSIYVCGKEIKIGIRIGINSLFDFYVNSQKKLGKLFYNWHEEP